MAWTDEKRAAVIEEYTSSNPTSKNTIELITSIAENHGETVNGVRIILQRANVYVKKEADDKKPATAPKEGAVAKVSKADSIAALVAAINDTGYIVDDEIISKLTGKQAVYFCAVIKAASTPTEE